MSYVQQPIIDEEEEKKNTGEPLVVTEGEGGPIAGAPVAQGAEVKTPAALRPAGYTDVQAYLRANQPEALSLAQRVSGKIGEQGEAAKTAITQAGTEFGGKVEAARTPYQEELIKAAAANPTAYLDDAQKAQLIAQRQAQYLGPMTMDTAALQQKVTDVEKAREGIETEAGRIQLLQSILRRPTEGNVRLSQLLLGQTPEARQYVTEQTTPYATLRDYLTQTQTGAEQKATEAKTEAEKARETFAKEFGGATQAFQTGLQERVGQARTEQAARSAAALAALTGGAVTPQALADLGITEAQINEAKNLQKTIKTDYGVDVPLTQFLTQMGPEIQAADVATMQDLARQRALEELAGVNIGLLSPEQQARFGGAQMDISDYQQQAATQELTNILGSRDKDIIDRYFGGGIGQNETEVLTRAKQRQPQYWAAMEAAHRPVEMPSPTLGQQITGGVVGLGTAPLWLPAAAGLQAITNPEKFASNVVQTFKNPVKAVTNVANTVASVFCFRGDTLVDMADGSKKPISEVELGDKMREGGDVTSVRKSKCRDGDLFNYGGIAVTGSHAVREGDKWIRVKQSKHATPVAGSETVYSVVNENHIIRIEEQAFADEHETDNYENLTLDQSLEELNRAGWR